MPVELCATCRREMSTEARRCPHCGRKRPARRPIRFRSRLLWLVGALVVFGVSLLVMQSLGP